MKTTLLDDYIGTCVANKDKLHVCAAMGQVLKATTPVAHVWETPNAMVRPLAPAPLVLPDAAMCLCVLPGITPGYYRFCVDQNVDTPILGDWIGRCPWSLEGLLVYQYDANTFDAIPLVRQLAGGNTIMPELQIHFTWTADGWIWQKSKTGHVNPYFHDVMIRMLDDQETLDNSITYLGSVINCCLGSYLDYINRPGKWQVYMPREPKLKVKNGKVKKVYQVGSVGYKQFIPGANDGQCKDEIAADHAHNG
jgi:hypothetical protein